MEVRKVRKILAKIDMLLANYENKTLDQALDHLLSLSEKRPDQPQETKRPKGSAANFEPLSRRIRTIGSEAEALDLLLALEKSRLLDFSRHVDVRVDKRDNKLAIAKTILVHLGFQRLNKKISERSAE